MLPIYDFDVHYTVDENELQYIKSLGYPKYAFNADRFNMEDTNYRNIFRSIEEIKSTGEVVTRDSPEWLLDIIASAADEGETQLLVRESHDSRFFFITVNVSITITAPVVTAQPSDLTVNEGDLASFTASASGDPTPVVEWFKDDSSTGVSDETYSFTAEKSDDGSEVYAMFSNEGGDASSNTATLTVNYEPVVTTQPSNQTASVGDTITLNAAADGKPTPVVEWFRNGNSVSTDESYSFSASKSQNGQDVYAVFTNSVGTATTDTASLNILYQPTFTTQPANRQATAGNDVQFNCQADANPTATYEWFYNDGTGWASTGVTTRNGQFTTSIEQDGWLYRCTATNSEGSTFSNTVTLTVLEPEA